MSHDLMIFIVSITIAVVAVIAMLMYEVGNMSKALIGAMAMCVMVGVLIVMTISREPGAQTVMATSHESVPSDRHQVFVGDAPVVRVVVPATTSVVIDRPVAERRSDPFPVMMPVFRSR